MSVEAVTLFTVVCDSCKATFDYEDGGGDELWESVARAENHMVDRMQESEDGDWTTDGEGNHHCGNCSSLTMTDAAIAERARKLTAADVPLFEAAS